VSGDDGAASIYVLTTAMLLAAVSVPVAVVATGLAAHREAVKAADLAVLAGAQRSLYDADAACATAVRVAAANGGRLARCDLRNGSLVVEVRVPLQWSFLPEVSASARAGHNGTPLG
jgi:secretion/DNA translocation related TadE-like protein